MRDLNSVCHNLESEFRNSIKHKNSELDSSIDPNNLFDSIDTSCSYFTDTEFKKNVSAIQGLSFIHFNARSLCSNFDSIKTYIQDLNKPFDVIAISETWLNEHVNIKDYSIDNYQLYNTNRTSKRGGVVLLYVLNNYEVELITQMSLCVDDILESITVEIQIPNTKNIMVSCMYRPPGGNIEIFNEHLQILLDSVKHKNYILCGDMNINLLNTENHTGTRMFLDLMYTYGLYPLINKPTRITLGCSTLIDNIFSNILCKSKSGVLINDISDHLPIFCCIEYGRHMLPNLQL
jgi:hypothetical protein